MWRRASARNSTPARFPMELDLSMEVMQWVIQSIRRVDRELYEELQSVFAKENCTATSAHSDDLLKVADIAELERLHADIFAKHAGVAVVDVAHVLKRFYPDMPRQELAAHVHSVAHADKMLATSCGGPLRRALQALVPRDSKDWLCEDLALHVAAKRGLLSTPRWLALQANVLRKDPVFRAAAITGSGGAVTLGAAGAPLGMAAGAVAGALCGIGPAFFTFGLSIPAFAAIGGGMGACTGAFAGASFGLFGGGALGALGCSYKAELKAFAGWPAEDERAKTPFSSNAKESGMSLYGGKGDDSASA